MMRGTVGRDAKSRRLSAPAEDCSATDASCRPAGTAAETLATHARVEEEAGDDVMRRDDGFHRRRDRHRKSNIERAGRLSER